MALAYLTGTATQGSADAFVEAEVATALAGISNVAYRIREILFQLPAASNASGATFQLQLNRRSKTAIANVTDRDVIAYVMRQNVITTSGAHSDELIYRLTFTEDDELLVVEDPIYFACDSAATTLTSTFYCRIGYERTSISQVDRLTLLTASLE